MDELEKDIPQKAAVTDENITEQEATGYQPRPKWQVWAARVALVVFIIIVIMSYFRIARGGF